MTARTGLRSPYSSDTAAGAIGLTLLLCAVVQALTTAALVPAGDDIIYGGALDKFTDKYGPWLGWPAYSASHWLSTNGRLANFLAPVFLSVMPAWLTDIAVGTSLALLLQILIRSVMPQRRFFLASALIIALTALTLPWYDNLAMIDCWLNYPMALLMSLWWIRLWLAGRHTVWCILFGLAAGLMHEGCSVAVSAGVLIYLFCNRKDGLPQHLIRTSGYLAATLLCFLSPGILGRLGTASDPAITAPRLETLLLSDFYPLLLAAVVLLFCCTATGRKRLQSILRTDWILYAVTAAISAIVSVYSAIPGRSGFFAQAFALIALGRMALALPLSIPARAAGIVGSLLLSAVATQLIITLHWQETAYSEWQTVEALAEKSESGIVYADIHAPEDYPAATLGKCITIPCEHSEKWYRYMYYEYGRQRPLTIVPAP